MRSDSAPRSLRASRAVLPMRISAFLAASQLLAACASAPPPPLPPPPQPPAEPAPPPPPPLARLWLPPIRSVDSQRVPRAAVEAISPSLAQRVAGAGRYALVQAPAPTAGADGAPRCVTEACERETSAREGAEELLYTRLVQYADSCVLLAVLYEPKAGANRWAWTQTFACEPAAVEVAVRALGDAFVSRNAPPPSGPLFAVAPVQHDIADVAFASESFAPYVTALLAAAGKNVVIAADVAAKLPPSKLEAARACGSDKCAVELGAAVNAERVVAVRITKRRAQCTATATVLDVSTKKPLGPPTTSPGGCVAPDLAASLRTVAEAIGAASAGDDLR